MRSLKQILAVLLLAVLLAGMTPAAVFGAKNDVVKLTVSSTLFVMQGESSYVDVEASAPEGTDYKLVLQAADRNITVDNGTSGILSGNAKQTFSFTVNRKAETGYKTLTLKAVDASDATNVLGEQNVYVDIVENINSFSSLGQASINVTYAITGSDSLTAGEVNFVKLTLFNRGNTIINNAKVEITMPEGLTIQSGPASRNIGTFGIGETNSVDYPILVDPDLTTGSYPITVKVSGVRAGEAKEASEAIYLPLVGKEKEGPKDESVPLLIVDSFDYGANNGILKRGQDFTLKMTFLNTGSKEIKNAVINVLDNTGAVVPTESSFIKIDSIKPGEKVNGSIGLRTVEGSDATQTSLGVEMNYYYGEESKQNQSTYPILVSIEKKPDESKPGGVANPILMVTNYSFGSDKAVLANSEFPLSLTITNTSAKTLRNIKVTVQDSTGSILPAEGSNSFFINSIGAGGSYGKLMPMAVSNDIKAGVSTIAVNMSYEDMDAHTFTSSDTITVPVTQQDRLVIDDILDPGYLTAGEAGYAQIKYYNMGQTTLNNLRIAVSGDFTIDGDSSQYVGNMANGRSDYFSFNFIPNGEGEMNGKAVFTYENSQGEEQVIEKDFTFNIQPAPEFDPSQMDFPAEEEKHGFAALPIWGKGLVALGALLAVILVIKGIKKHKKAKAEALTLDE